jgi:hypothetical protein
MKKVLSMILVMVMVLAFISMPNAKAEGNIALNASTLSDFVLLDITHNGNALSTDRDNPTFIQKGAMLTVRGEGVANETIEIQAIVDGEWTRGGYVAEFDNSGKYAMINSPFFTENNKGDVKSFALAIMDTSTEKIFSQTPTYYLEYGGDDSNKRGRIATFSEFYFTPSK